MGEQSRVSPYNTHMQDFEDSDDVTTRPRVQAEQHGNTDQERNQRTRKLLKTQHADVKADIRTIKYGASIRVLRALERKWGK